jgi:hypothetical protein
MSIIGPQGEPWSLGDLSHYMQGKLIEWAQQNPEVWQTREQLLGQPLLYQGSLKYLLQTMRYHQDPELERFLVKVRGEMGSGATILDLGCATGTIGAWFAAQDHPVLFYDYEGFGLRFLHESDWDGWIKKERSAPRVAHVVSYDEPAPRASWVLALDVMEHTGDPLRFLYWIGALGRHFAVSYPVEIAFRPPFMPQQIDEWVDDEAVNWVIERRYRMLESYRANGRRYIIFRKAD